MNTTQPTLDAQSELAKHGDPSIERAAAALPQPKKGIAWVRPSELPLMIAGQFIGRGLDLQTELVRKVQRPAATKPSEPKVTRTAIARPTVEAAHHEGQSL